MLHFTTARCLLGCPAHLTQSSSQNSCWHSSQCLAGLTFSARLISKPKLQQDHPGAHSPRFPSGKPKAAATICGCRCDSKSLWALNHVCSQLVTFREQLPGLHARRASALKCSLLPDRDRGAAGLGGPLRGAPARGRAKPGGGRRRHPGRPGAGCSCFPINKRSRPYKCCRWRRRWALAASGRGQRRTARPGRAGPRAEPRHQGVPERERARLAVRHLRRGHGSGRAGGGAAGGAQPLRGGATHLQRGGLPGGERAAAAATSHAPRAGAGGLQVGGWVGAGGGRAPPRGREPWEPRGARRDRHGTARRCRCPPARLGFSSRQSVWAQPHTRRFPKVMEFGAPTGASSWEKPPLALKACTTPLFFLSVSLRAFLVAFSQKNFLGCFLSQLP